MIDINKIKEIYEKYYKRYGAIWQKTNKDIALYAYDDGVDINVIISIPQMYAEYTKYSYRKDIALSSRYGIRLMKDTYTDVNEFYRDIIKLSDYIRVDVWLIVKYIGKYVNKNNRVKVEFIDGTKYSLNVDNIISIVEKNNKKYIGYRTKNVEYYKSRFPTANNVSGKAKMVYTVYKAVCAECGKYWEYDADEPYDYCIYCGSTDKKTIKLLRW